MNNLRKNDYVVHFVHPFGENNSALATVLSPTTILILIIFISRLLIISMYQNFFADDGFVFVLN
jgi:hypothetical protein